MKKDSTPAIEVARALAWALLEVIAARRDELTQEQRERTFGVRILLEVFDAELDNCPRDVMGPRGTALARTLADLLDGDAAAQVRRRAAMEDSLMLIQRQRNPSNAQLRRAGLPAVGRKRRTVVGR